MELLLIIVFFAILFFAFFKVDKSPEGKIYVASRIGLATTTADSQDKKTSLDSSKKKFFKSRSFYTTFLTIGFILIELYLFFQLLIPIETLITVKTAQLIPDKFNPIARFAATMDWDNKKIYMDASMSKAYNDAIENYIWRIDDGSSFVGVNTLEHEFKYPGYYLIQLSVVDADGQSDVATCQIMIPPTELEKVSNSEVLRESGDDQMITDVEYEWAPVGTFFNYTKMDYYQRSYANLKSQYIESGCGYSNSSYNVSENSTIDFFQDYRVQQALTIILRTSFFGFVLLPVVYILLMMVVRKKFSNIIS